MAKLLMEPGGCQDCGDDLMVETNEEQRDGYAWYAMDGDPVTCAGCGKKGEIAADGESAWANFPDDEEAA